MVNSQYYLLHQNVHHSHIPQCNILYQTCAHACTFLFQNVALWDICLMQWGAICEMGLFDTNIRIVRFWRILWMYYRQMIMYIVYLLIGLVHNVVICLAERHHQSKYWLIVGHLNGTIGAKFPYNFWVIESFLCTTVLHYTVHILLHIEFVLFPNSELGTDGSFSVSLFTNDRYNFLKGHNQALIILINGLINVLSSARYHCSIWTQTAKKKLFESQYKYFLSKLSWDMSYVSVKWPCWTLSMFVNKLCRSSGILILPKWYPII